MSNFGVKVADGSWADKQNCDGWRTAQLFLPALLPQHIITLGTSPNKAGWDTSQELLYFFRDVGKEERCLLLFGCCTCRDDQQMTHSFAVYLSFLEQRIWLFAVLGASIRCSAATALPRPGYYGYVPFLALILDENNTKMDMLCSKD